MKYGRYPIQKLEMKNACRQLCFINAFHNFHSVFIHRGLEVGLVYFFVTDSDFKNVRAYLNYDTTSKVLVFLNLWVFNPASKSVKIDFENERQSEPGVSSILGGEGRRRKGTNRSKNYMKKAG
jgi:hypothetical protein